MKKTLMALCFALCATFAFAQTNRTASRIEKASNSLAKVSQAEAMPQQANYKGSIFTKTGELMYCDFATENSGYTTGTLSSTDVVDGTAIGDLAHTQTQYHATWHRIADTTANTCTALKNAGQYVVTFNYPTSGFSTLSGLDSETPMAGLMIMTMQDQIPSWGGHGTIGGFNAYIAFSSFSTTGTSVVDVRFYQYYRKFNGDHCWIDYSANGTDWYGYEINVKNVDVAVNNARRGWITTTLPALAGNQANLYLRLRWACNEQNGAYGYLWIVDDFMAIGAPDNRLKVSNNNYYDGFYHQMPQGLQIPVTYQLHLRNTGNNNQSSVDAKVMAGTVGSAATMIANHAHTTTFNTFDEVDLNIDPLGIIQELVIDPTTVSNQGGTTGYIPTTTAGQQYVYADVTSNLMDHIYDSITFDTNIVIVNTDATTGAGVWGRDNGVLSNFNVWAYGMVGANTFSDDPTEVLWDNAGYGVSVAYTTGATIPTDASGRPWVIKGVQLVPATENGYAEAGVNLGAILTVDSLDPNNEGSFFLKNLNHGASVHTTTAAELNNPTNMEYVEDGQYNFVTIDFPNQPELVANSTFRVGYELIEDGAFSVSANRTFYYNLDDSTATYYYNDPAMHLYGNTFDVANRFGATVYDPYDNDIHFFSWGEFPMIRMIVGPWEYRPMTTVTFECGDNGTVFDNTYENELCGTTDSVVLGSTNTFLFSPDDGYMVDQVTVNGTVEFTNDTMQGDINYTLENVQEPTTVNVTFREHVSIDPVAASVAVKLQPNPATSNVKLSISGVTGMVNVAIIDMSGRVISNQNVNAADAQTINVSNFAKGAYFVRITNSNFTKVEKLIVR